VVPRVRFAVETLLDRRVQDDYGQDLALSCTRIRYEVTIVRRTISGIDRFFVEQEKATPIRKDEDRWKPYGKIPSGAFRDHFLKYTRRNTPFLNTVDKDSAVEFLLHQDNKQGRTRHIPAVEAERSVLSTVTLAREFPHLYALRKELEGLRYLQLDPAAERKSSPLDAPEILEQDGSNLAAVLYRIEQETRSDQSPQGVIADILADVSEIIPGITKLAIERDDERREYRLRLIMRDGQIFSSRVVSDGTLRVLALITLLHDPQHRGTLCFEEPENGVHKSRLERLMKFLQESCVNPHMRDQEDNTSLLQIIVNTHSIVAARSVKRTIFLAEIAEIVGAGVTQPRRCTRLEPYEISEQEELPLGSEVKRATVMKIEQFLEEHEQTNIAA
jgi:hypothetical protein